MSRSSSARSSAISRSELAACSASPSAARSSATRMRARGVRSSCETLASSSRWARMSSPTRSAISLNASATSPSSSLRVSFAREPRFPAPRARAALERTLSGRASQAAVNTAEMPTSPRIKMSGTSARDGEGGGPGGGSDAVTWPSAVSNSK